MELFGISELSICFSLKVPVKLGEVHIGNFWKNEELKRRKCVTNLPVKELPDKNYAGPVFALAFLLWGSSRTQRTISCQTLSRGFIR